MKKMFSRLDNKKIAVISTVVFIVSMIPLWYLARYARPSGDDYGYSYMTHAAWLDTHSLWAVFKAAVETVKWNYMTWNGDWFTTFLFSLMPEVFEPWTFWIVPLVMSASLIAGTSIFLYRICVKILGMAREDFVILNNLLLFISFQYTPSLKIGMYWYVGAVHYILPHMWMLLALVAAWCFWETGKWRYLAAAILWTFMIGGSSYFSCLIIFILYLILMAVGFKKNKKVVWLIIPFLICLVGFVVQCKSPGNITRGGNEFGFHAGTVVLTIFEALWKGLVTIGTWFKEKTFIFIVLLIFAVFGWEALLKSKRKIKCPYPLLFVILMYGCYSSQFAPEIYAAVDVSAGPITMEYLTFVLAAAMAVLYVEGWAINKLAVKENRIYSNCDKWRFKVLIPVVLGCIVLTLFNLNWIGASMDKAAWEYVVSGQADDFKEQIESQMEILLDDSVKEAYLVPINDEQGPLMHMPVTADEDAFTNWAVRCFYRKDKVVMKGE